MKKSLLVLAICAISNMVSAQQEVKFGPKAGANFSTLSDVSKAKMLPGFYVGAFAEIKFSEKLSLQPEVLYSSQGAKNIYKETIGGVEFDHHNHDKIDYINIPLIVKYNLTSALSLEVGPQFGFLINAQNLDEVTSNGVTVESDRSFKDEVNAFDFAAAAGLSYKVYDNFFVNARYNFGITKVGKENQYYSNSKNGVAQVGVGYQF